MASKQERLVALARDFAEKSIHYCETHKQVRFGYLVDYNKTHKLASVEEIIAHDKDNVVDLLLIFYIKALRLDLL